MFPLTLKLEVVSVQTILLVITTLLLVLKFSSEKRKTTSSADLDEFSVMTNLNQAVLAEVSRLEQAVRNQELRLREMHVKMLVERRRTTLLTKRVRQLEMFITSQGMEVPASEEEEIPHEVEDDDEVILDGLISIGPVNPDGV